MVDRRVRKAAAKSNKPPISKKALERLVTINNGGESIAPPNAIKRSGSEEPEFAPMPSSISNLTSRPKEGVTNVKPAMQKPKFDFAALRASSSLMGQLPSFLDQMKAANAELEAERKAGTLKDRKIEIDDTSSEEETSSGESSDDEDEEMEEGGEKKAAVKKEGKEKVKKEKKEKKERGQYIEMNLGLGVLEEKNPDDETSSSGSSDEESEDEDMGMTVMDKLQGTDKEEVEGRKKAGIEVVKET